MEMTLVSCVFVILPIIIFLSAITDIYSYSIPNSFSVILIIGFYIFAFLNPVFDYEMIGYHTLTGFIVLFVTFIMFSLNLFGGGDAKIIASSSLWFGGYDTLLYIAYISIAGGILSVILFLWRKTKPLKFYERFTPLKRLYYGPTDYSDITQAQKAIPYAVGIAIGFFIMLPKSMIYTKLFEHI